MLMLAMALCMRTLVAMRRERKVQAMALCMKTLVTMRPKRKVQAMALRRAIRS